MIDFKNSLDVIIGICVLVGIVYRISHMEASIYREIDKVSDKLSEQIHSMQMDFSIHRADYAVRKEWHTETAHGLKQMIKHKFSRLNFHIIDIQQHLKKQTGFVVRSQPVVDPDDIVED
ncbi:hypothetical protein LC593_07270 [Nostoc sp. CHAB 5844]|nr:hypothetical protein [Nostoc sp. CHAB 5844]